MIAMQGMHRRHRHGRRGRLPKPVFIGWTPGASSRNREGAGEAIVIDGAEVEALRLVDLEGLSQEEAGELLGVSRGTVWRLIQSGRMKVVRALVEGRALQVMEPVGDGP